MTMVTAKLRSAIDRLGYVVKRKARSPYPELKDVPRYEQKIVMLDGKTFRIGDAASFVAGYDEIFVDQIYKFDNVSPSPRIVDCGANFGISLFYFKKHYPSSTIIAIEADPAVFSILEENTRLAGYDDVNLINKALSVNHDPICFFSEGADGGRSHFLADARQSQMIQTITLDDLLTKPTDFLKIDIEGGETAALLACTTLHHVRQLFIEYHSFIDSEQTLQDILSVLTRSGFRYYVQTQHCARRPLTEQEINLGMDLQLNIFATRRQDS